MNELSLNFDSFQTIDLGSIFNIYSKCMYPQINNNDNIIMPVIF